MPPKNISILRVLLINILVFFGVTTAFELGIRFLFPSIQPVGMDAQLVLDRAFGESEGPRPGAIGGSNGVLRVVDEQGFWEYGASTQNLPGWLLLGDSVTMGMGVEADSTFAGRLASVQGQYDILNPSLPGHASNDYLEIVRVVIAERDVERVTLFWCLNDVMGGTPIETAPEGTRLLDNPVMAFVRKHIRTYTWAKATFTDRSKAYFLHDRDLYERDGSLFEDSMADVRAIRSLLQTTNIPFHVVLLPYEYELRNREEEPRSSLQNRFESMGIQVLSLADEMAWEDPSRYYLYGDGIHFSLEGHREIAERVNAFLPTIRE